MATSTCPQCNKVFNRPPSLMTFYCSRECQKEAARIKKTCPNCGKEFWFHKKGYVSKTGEKVYCSRQCQSEAAKATRSCKVCGKEFTYYKSWPVEHCSSKCASVTANAPRNTRHISNCEVCGKEFLVTPDNKGRFCSLQCWGKWLSENGPRGEDHPNWRGGYEPYYGPNWRRQRRKVRERDNYTCRRCGVTEKDYGKALDVHHCVPFRTFGRERYREANNLSNLIALCNVCHTTVDNDPSELAKIWQPA